MGSEMCIRDSFLTGADKGFSALGEEVEGSLVLVFGAGGVSAAGTSLGGSSEEAGAFLTSCANSDVVVSSASAFLEGASSRFSSASALGKTSFFSTCGAAALSCVMVDGGVILLITASTFKARK